MFSQRWVHFSTNGHMNYFIFLLIFSELNSDLYNFLERVQMFFPGTYLARLNSWNVPNCFSSIIWAWQINRRFRAGAHNQTSRFRNHPTQQWAVSSAAAALWSYTWNNITWFQDGRRMPHTSRGWEAWRVCPVFLLRWDDMRAEPWLKWSRKRGRCPPSSGHHHSPQHRRHRIPGLCFVVSNNKYGTNRAVERWTNNQAKSHWFDTSSNGCVTLFVTLCGWNGPFSAKLQRYVSATRSVYFESIKFDDLYRF